MAGNRHSGCRPWWNLEPCGTAAAYRRHVRLGEPKDQACRDAHAAEARWYYAKARDRAMSESAGEEAA
jgi:hypothetical protein